MLEMGTDPVWHVPAREWQAAKAVAAPVRAVPTMDRRGRQGRLAMTAASELVHRALGGSLGARRRLSSVHRLVQLALHGLNAAVDDLIGTRV